MTSSGAGKPMPAVTQSRGTILQHHLDRRAHAYYSKLQEPLQLCVLRWEQTEYGSVLPQGMTYNPWD
jgi:hypothetical protein